MTGSSPPRRDRILTAAIAASLGAILATTVVWIVTSITGGSFRAAVSKPSFWVVEVTTVVVVGLAVYFDRPREPSSEEAPARSTARVVLERMAWAVAVVILIAVLLAIATENSIASIVTSRPFLIAGSIGIIAAALEAWPSDDDRAARDREDHP